MLSGSCLCGAVQYTLDIPEQEAKKNISICHCRSCRKITGATTSLNLIASAPQFTLVHGELKTKEIKHVDEGFIFTVAFCADCGSPIYAAAPFPGLDDPCLIQAGTLDNEALLESTPLFEVNVWKRLGWVGRVEGAEQREKY